MKLDNLINIVFNKPENFQPSSVSQVSQGLKSKVLLILEKPFKHSKNNNTKLYKTDRFISNICIYAQRIMV